MSRYNFEYVNEDGDAVAMTPGAGMGATVAADVDIATGDAPFRPETKVVAGEDDGLGAVDEEMKEENGNS